MVEECKFDRLGESEQKIVKFIVANIEKDVLENLDNAIHTEYARDVGYLMENRPHVAHRLKPQLHRYAIDQIFIDHFGFEVLENTKPKGEFFTMYTNGSISLSHCEIHQGEKKRPVKHRKMMASKNEAIEPHQYSLGMFNDEQKEEFDKTIHIALYTVHKSKELSEATEPEGVYVAVPYSDWSGFHLFESLQLILGMYENEDLEAMEDMAFVELRDVMTDREKDIFKR
ncbi:hypothetical protein DS891_20135 [Pseudoalteromonas sp. JC28]|uniref:hypothetical protein n=1 Tax=Pseudoalteromonas sp. JC28 TaxID=2267617 RepID=UPI001574BE5D|nr:hypothetical protein [Pseudoalteromonas sp. JC28]NSY35841.1 hypothetical protein [Pseudoalteromonas sp. JC28]